MTYTAEDYRKAAEFPPLVALHLSQMLLQAAERLEQRCETCREWRRTDSTVQGGRCLLGTGQAHMDGITIQDFGCNRWQPQEPR